MTRSGSFPIIAAPGNLFARPIRQTRGGGLWFKLQIERGSPEEGEDTELPEMFYADSLFDLPTVCRTALN